MDKIGVIFDMDGVIVDNHLYHRKSWRTFAEKHGKTISDQEYNEKMNGRTVAEVVKVVFGEAVPAEKVKQYSDEKEALYRELYGPHLEPVPGIVAFLKLLREKGIPTAVATSAPTDNVVFTLDGLDLRQYFDSILDDRAVTKGKPHPQIYEKSVAALGLSPEQCVVFEDALAGMEAARGAGTAVIALATTHPADELSHADEVISDFKGIGVDFVKKVIENNSNRTGSSR
ncbi:HAD family hydrolase [Roseivirga sp. BDSF3-8]|uniref:HAD family hydrolase n=1 Tax=Roseivirga sp. BDSF3-8 TaxID=3241598 RepID=UPI00353185B5